VQTTRLAESFELLTTRLEIFPHKATCDPVILAQKSPKAARHESV